jgi:hypothetical protein
MPYVRSADEIRVARPESPLFVRLRGETPIDPDSIYGFVRGCGKGEVSAEWQPVAEDDFGDIWVVFRPNGVWRDGETIVVTAGARATSAGRAVRRRVEFLIRGEEPLAGDLEDPAGAFADGPGRDAQAVTVRPYTGTAVAELAGGLDLPYAIGPEQGYEMPQQVELPVPREVDPADVRLYYFHGGGRDEGWYPAEQVEGWLVPNSCRLIEVDGQTYISFSVRHAGIVGLELRADTRP